MSEHIFGDRHAAVVAAQLAAARFWERSEAGKPGPLNETLACTTSSNTKKGASPEPSIMDEEQKLDI